MTPNDFYKSLQVAGLSEVTLSPGPLTIRVNEQDAMAGNLLLWLQEQVPDAFTVRDLFEVLDAAKWWATFWASLPREDDEEEEVSTGGQDGTSRPN
jgi:hypothetical protein